jgi:hypothetical protein
MTYFYTATLLSNAVVVLFLNRRVRSTQFGGDLEIAALAQLDVHYRECLDVLHQFRWLEPLKLHRLVFDVVLDFHVLGIKFLNKFG